MSSIFDPCRSVSIPLLLLNSAAHPPSLAQLEMRSWIRKKRTRVKTLVSATISKLKPNELQPRPDISNDLSTQLTKFDSTAEIAANAPRYRRKSSTFIDGIHDVSEDSDMAPAQLYSTMSGRLFHSGRIAIVMVGLPARGKT